MRFRRFFATVMAATVASTLAVVAMPEPAGADDPLVKVSFLWVRCQDDTGEWGADEIQIEVNGNPGDPVGIINDMHVGQTKNVGPQLPPYQPTQDITGDSIWVWVWERDDPNNRSTWDLQGIFEIRRDWADTGERESYAFYDGQFIIRYIVYTV